MDPLPWDLNEDCKERSAKYNTIFLSSEAADVDIITTLIRTKSIKRNSSLNNILWETEVEPSGTLGDRRRRLYIMYSVVIFI